MEDTSIELKEYFNKLSPTAKSVIASSEWQNRLSEIGKKYSLNEKQIFDLGYEVIFVIVGMEPLETLMDNMVDQLGISRLLAEQITGDIQSRVISYIIDMVEKKEKTQSAPTTTVMPTTQTELQNTKRIEIEIRPNDIPQKEIIPPLSSTPLPKYTPLYKPMPHAQKTQVETKTERVIPQITPAPANMNPSEPVQRPLAVPRINALSDEVATEIAGEKSIAESIIDSKLHGIVGAPQETPSTSNIDTIKKYTVDPYREPIE